MTLGTRAAILGFGLLVVGEIGLITAGVKLSATQAATNAQRLAISDRAAAARAEERQREITDHSEEMTALQSIERKLDGRR